MSGKFTKTLETTLLINNKKHTLDIIAELWEGDREWTIDIDLENMSIDGDLEELEEALNDYFNYNLHEYEDGDVVELKYDDTEFIEV